MAAIADACRAVASFTTRLCGPMLIASAIVSGAVAAAQGPGPSSSEFNLTEPQPGVYVHLGRNLPLDVPGHDDIANIGFIVGSRCIAVIDTGGSVHIGRELKAEILRRTALPVCYVINTHAHVDHVLGNFAFKDDKPHFVGHTALAEAMIRNRPYFMKEYAADFDAAPSAEQIVGPDQRVGRELSLDLGHRTLRLIAWPTAHSDCDLTVYDERTGTLWTGDLVFRERLPALDGNLKGWLAAIDSLSRMNSRLVIPGHGSLSSDLAGSLTRERAYLLALDQGVRDELARGQSMQDAIDHVALSERGRWTLWQDVHPRNVARAYEELQWE
jgi:quinoprotein relay system zinc metallohydrolase 2